MASKRRYEDSSRRKSYEHQEDSSGRGDHTRSAPTRRKQGGYQPQEGRGWVHRGRHGGSQQYYDGPPDPPKHNGGSGSSYARERSTHEPVEQVEPVQGALASIKSMGFPLRPGKGSRGTRCIVKANHFFAQVPDKDLYHYDVTITPEVKSHDVNRSIMEQLVKLYRDSLLGKRLPAYDGRKGLYTAGPLPLDIYEFKITLDREDRDFNVVIKLAARVNLHHLERFLAGRQADAPQQALQVLDIVLRQLPTYRYYSVGQSFYSPYLGRRQPLGEGLECWRGFYQSMRPTQMGLSLNIDMSSATFIEPQLVIDLVIQLLNTDALERPLSDSECVKIKKALRGIRVEGTHCGKMRRRYKVCGLTSQATKDLKFIDGRDTMQSVVGYFRETYGYSIQQVQWPCLQVGNPQKPNYLPMEVCKIVERQMCSKRLNEQQITAVLKVTCKRPQEREHDIIKVNRCV